VRKELVRMIPEPSKKVLRLLVIYPLRSYFRYFPLRAGKKLLWRHLASHLWWLESKTKAKTRFGPVLEVDARDIQGRFISCFGVWEPQVTACIQARLRQGDGFIDVGANIGYYSLLAAGLVGPVGKVVAIEAVPRTFESLKRNLAANGIENVRPLNIAAWDRQQVLTMFVEPSRITGTSTLVPDRAGKWELSGRCEVRADALAKILDSEEIRLARLIKIDVEGAEWRAVSGLIPVLRTGRRDLEIIIELATDLDVEGKTYRDVLSLFREEGFFPYLIENDYSAASHISNTTVKRPKRMEEVPAGVDEIDVIFSRSNAEAL